MPGPIFKEIQYTHAHLPRATIVGARTTRRITLGHYGLIIKEGLIIISVNEGLIIIFNKG